MGHSANQLPILKNRAAAHPLHNTAGGGDQLRIGDRDHQFSAVRRIRDRFQDLNGVFLHLIAGNVAADHSRTFRRVPYRQRFPLCQRTGCVQGTENAAAGIGVKLSQLFRQIKFSPQLSGAAAASLFHRFHGGRQNGAVAEGHQGGGVPVRNAVAQGTKGVAIRVVVGDGADPRHAVPYPRTDAARPLFISLRLYGERHRAALPLDGQFRGVRTVFLQERLKLLCGCYRPAAAGLDDVAGFQAAGAGRRTALRQLHHYNTP